MNDHREGLLAFATGFTAMLLGWLGAHKAVINEALSQFTLYGGAFLTAIGLWQWFKGWLKRRKHIKNE